jgi:hypothetical protein
VPVALSAQKVVKPEIKYVTLTDTALISEIKKYIKVEEKIDTLFAKGKGYILLSFSGVLKRGKRVSETNYATTDTVFTYYLQTSYMAPEKGENLFEEMYPMFYSIVGGRLVNITDPYFSSYLGFAEKSKKRYRKIVEKYLEPVGAQSRRWLVITRQTRICFIKKPDSSDSGNYDYHVTIRKTW